MNSMVVATDGSDTAKQVVGEAARVAQRLGSKVHLVTAYTPLRAPQVSGGSGNLEVSGRHILGESRADSILIEACAEMRKAGVDAESHACTGSPADAILDLVEEIDADVVVVGSKGLSGGRRRLLGSVPNTISHHAQCHVLIIHTA
jgi:nucleotide-binding universal stress UspA family protein